jgi:hypothetical protein
MVDLREVSKTRETDQELYEEESWFAERSRAGQATDTGANEQRRSA